MAKSKEERVHRARKWYCWFGVVALLIGVMLYFYFLYPKQEIGPKQPIFFSHRVHAGVKAIDCRFCHSNVDRSAHAGLPEVEKCFYCHKYIIPMHPQLVEEKKYLDTKTPVPWVRIFYVPDFVKFKHEPHIQWAKLDCTECHGQVATKDRLEQVGFEMQFCITCHKKLDAQTDCWLACHH